MPSECSNKGFPCIGDNDNPICIACTSNTSNPNYDYNNNKDWEWRTFKREQERRADHAE